MLASANLEDLLWTIAKDVGQFLDFEDFVLYLREGDVFKQKAAYGQKSPQNRKIKNDIEIKLGEGIVGSVGLRGVSERIDDLSRDARYLVDNIPARSELCVPLIYQEQVIAIFDSESSRVKGFSTKDQEMLETLANISAPRIATAIAEAEKSLFVEKLRHTEKQYRLLIDDMPEPIFIHSGNKMLSCNNAALKLLGYTHEEILSIPVSQHIHPEDLTASQKRRLHILSGQSLVREAIRYFKKNGDVLVGETYGYQSHFDGKDSIISVVHDVSARILVEKTSKEINIELERRVARRTKQLIESEEQVKLLLESTAEAIYGLDTKGICTFCNPACVKTLGYQSEQDLIGKNMHALVHYKRLDGSDYPNNECKIFKSFRKGEESHVDDEVFWRADSTSFPVEYWSHPIRREGKIIGSVVTFFDISQRIELEAQQLQLQKMQALGKLAGGIAHDLNNILTPILGFADMIAEDATKNDKGTFFKYAQSITNSAKRAKTLVAQILLFSQRKKSNQEISNLVPLIPEIVSFIRPTFPASIDIRTEITAKSAYANCNNGQIYQVLLNFCVNAMQAITTKGEICINLDICNLSKFESWTGKELNGEYVRLSVSDNGVGIDDSTLNHIFDPFFTTREMGNGVGLGLSTVFGIIENHDGGINVITEPGKGSCFEIYLRQVSDTKSETKSTPSVIPKYISNLTAEILVVEDEEAIALLCKLNLEKAGYRVTIANNGKEGLEIFEADPTRFKLVVTDQLMPGLTGTELAKKIHSAQSSMPIILTSGFNNLMLEDNVLPEGVNKLLDKPYSPLELRELVSRLLA